MKKLLSFLIGIVIFVLILFVGKNVIVKAAVERGVEFVTGLPLTMKSLNIHLLGQTFVWIEDLRLFNPKGYSGKVMVDMPEIYVDYDLPAVLKSQIHLNEVRIHLKEFVVVKNEKGELNLDSLKAVTAQQKPQEAKRAEKAAEGKKIQFQIDQLQLQIEKVIFKDYFKGGVPSVTPVIKEFNINLNEKYQNITDPNALVSLIVFKALANTTIARLANFDLGSLQGPISDVLGTSTKMVGLAQTQVEDKLKQAGIQPGGVTGELEETAKKGAETVKGLFGSLKKNLE